MGHEKAVSVEKPTSKIFWDKSTTFLGESHTGLFPILYRIMFRIFWKTENVDKKTFWNHKFYKNTVKYD